MRSWSGAVRTRLHIRTFLIVVDTSYQFFAYFFLVNYILMLIIFIIKCSTIFLGGPASPF